MKRIRISRCGAQWLAQPLPRRPSRPLHASTATLPTRRTLVPHNHRIQARLQSTAAVTDDPHSESIAASESSEPAPSTTQKGPAQPPPLESIPSPHPSAALRSAKLSALRSRLSLPPRFPLETLARTLVHPSADPDPNFNNESLSILGANLLGYYTSEHLMCNYPRLPMSVIFAAQYAYIGPKALTTIASEWGIEAAAEPGGEVDPGLLQFKRLRSGEEVPKYQVPWANKWRNTVTHKIVTGEEFGSSSITQSQKEEKKQPVPIEEAATSFVRALIGSLHLHLGRPLVKRFFRDHFLSRHLDLDKLFDFRTPTRDLSRLCAREGFESPVARLISETGRLSRHPVFVVGVYSGKDKLGEGAGSSLDEARIRAAAAALKSWYLYKPLEVTVPSLMEGETDATKWKPNLVDCGEVIV